MKNLDKDYFPIRQWAEDDRPREKLMNKGRHSLSDAELLAIIMRSGSKNESAVELAKKILKRSDDNLLELSKLSIKNLTSFKGVGQAKAISIIAALEVGKRRRNAEAKVRSKISCSKDVFDYFAPILGDFTYETFYILLLNRANKIMRHIKISEGGMTGTVADPKKIFKMALDFNATSIILCHNHPSGNIKPSDADIRLTKKLKNGGELLDIPVLDHLIIGDERYFSFSDESLL